MPLFYFPQVLNNTAEFSIAMRRIEALLLASETEYSPLVYASSDLGISIRNGEFEWTGEIYSHDFEKPAPIAPSKGRRDAKPVDNPDVEIKKPTESVAFALRNINLDIEKGSLVAVVGSVGSGKSSLLNALIGEMKTTSGTISFSGSLGYAAQTAWIQNANLRDNILFGKEYNHERYLNALLDAALLPDLKVLPDGDQTSIGERGINLSGGQKQRVNLARLIYNDSDIVLIDDPLSAVDAHVGKHLFDRCIRGALGNRTRILVTHQLHFLAQCDRIIVMKAGEISEQGSYQELISNNGEFSKMNAAYGSEEHEDVETGGEEVVETRARDLSELEQVLTSKTTGKDIMSAEDQESGRVPLH
ncbi:UNVERIFIED_CONTAM: hypothetical protein HDU68_005496, partial [Siphonaria sp. JEL0065]